MKNLILSFLTFFCSITAYCQHGYKQKIGGFAALTFPDTPKFQKVRFGAAFGLNHLDKLYLVDLFHPQIDTKNLSTDSIYDTYVRLNVHEPKDKLIYKNQIIIDGLDGIEFAYKENDVNPYRYGRAVYLNDTLITYGIWSPVSLKTNDKILTDFFNSFKLTANPQELKQSNVKKSNGMSYIVDVGLFILMICLIGIGIVFLVRRITR